MKPVGHWVTLVGMIFFAVLLIFSTIRDLSGSNTMITNSDLQREVNNIKDSNQKLINQIVTNNEETNQQLKELVKQIGRLVDVLEAQKVSENTTAK